MQFSDLYNEVITIRFNNNFVSQAKNWVNLRYAEVWNANEWTFRYTTANPTVTGGTQTLGGLPTAVQRVSYLYDDQGSPLSYLTPMEFFKTFYPSSTQSAQQASYYTVVNGTVYLGPTPSASSSSYLLVYEQKVTPMVNDTDIPAIPVEYHYMLVHGALATGLALQNDFTYAQQEEMFQEMLQSMTNAYTSDYGGTLQFQRDSLGQASVYQANGGIT